MKTTNNLQQFCQIATNVIQNPLLMQELIFDSANYITRNNPSHFSTVLCSPLLKDMVKKCISLYSSCIMSKLNLHFSVNELDDYLNMLQTARSLFYNSGQNDSFRKLINDIKNHRKCNKDLYKKLNQLFYD
jgi:hypothetical protein